MKTKENVLALHLSGIDPPSRRRRFKYLLRFWFPFPCFAAVWVGMAVLSEGIGREQWFVATVLTPAVMGIGLIFLRITFGSGAHRFRSNWQDYRLAGLPGREILWAFSQPAFKSGAWLTLLAFAAAIMFSIPHIGIWIDQGAYWAYWALLCVIVDAGFLLTGGTLLDTAVWGRASGMGSRTIAALTLLLCSGAILWLAIVLVLLSLGINPGGEETMMILILITVATLGLRIWWVRRAWKRAIQRLDGQLDY